MPRAKAVAEALPATLPFLPAALQTLAVVKGLKPPKEPLPPGEYPLHGVVTVKLACVVSQAESVMARQSVRLEAARLVAAACKRAGVDQGQLAELVEQAVRDAARAKPPADEQDYLDLAGAAIDRASEKLADKLEQQERKGPCKVTGFVELVEFKAA